MSVQAPKKRGRGRDFPDTREAIIRALYEGEQPVIAPTPEQLAEHPWSVLRASMDTYVVDYDDARHEYKIDGVDVPSVTQILDTTRNKPALQWWAFRVGMAGIVRAVQQRKLTYAQLQSWAWEPIIKPADHVGLDADTVEHKGKAKHAAERLVLELAHSPNHIKETKGTLGTSVHVAAEKLGISEEIPTIEDFPEDDRGYVQALARYWIAAECTVERQELILASKRFGFAGRCDKVARMPDGTLRLRDYKTSGGIYGDYDVQLSGYWIGYHEMGLHEQVGPLAGADLVHLMPDGSFNVVPATIDPGDFLVELLAFHQRRDADARIKHLGRTP